jgi:phytoene desaturase
MAERTANGQPLRAAVIGSGFGGIAAAIRLQAAGVQTTVLEAHDQPGGRARVFRDQGFTFDAGPTVITAPDSLNALFQLVGRELSEEIELLPVTPFYKLVWDDGDQFDYVGSSEQMVEQIRQRNPDDVEGYLKFVEYSKAVFHEGYDKLAGTPFLHFRDMLRVAPQLIKLRADRSVYSTVSRFVQHPHIREALSFHSLLVGGNPYETSSIYTLIHYLERNWGVYFPRGGTGALVQGLLRLFTSLGGTLRLSSPVERIDVVTLDGRTVHRVDSATQKGEHFDLVVSNADVHHTYSKLYRNHPIAAKRTRKLEKMDWSMSLFVLYFGTDIAYRDKLAHHTVLFGPRYKGLLDDIFHGDHLPDDFSLYLHAPSHTDPSLAPEGCGTFYVLSPVPHLGHANIDWSVEGPRYADKLLTALEQHLPDLRQHVVTKRWLTPASFRDELAAHHGAAFSVAPILTQSAWFRPHNADADIPGLYLVGAGTHPGAGVPGVVASAEATWKAIADDFGLQSADPATVEAMQRRLRERPASAPAVGLQEVA